MLELIHAILDSTRKTTKASSGLSFQLESCFTKVFLQPYSRKITFNNSWEFGFVESTCMESIALGNWTESKPEIVIIWLWSISNHKSWNHSTFARCFMTTSPFSSLREANMRFQVSCCINYRGRSVVGSKFRGYCVSATHTNRSTRNRKTP